MNERIRELALQAKIEFTYDPTETPMRAFVECWEDDLEKFAELIVRECAHLVGGYTKENEFGTDVKEAYEEITKHFGVEE
jgi:hypothetical protein